MENEEFVNCDKVKLRGGEVHFKWVLRELKIFGGYCDGDDCFWGGGQQIIIK